MNRNLRTSVSLFSGAGFGDMGFEAAGFNHDLLCEIDPSRTAFTSQNFPNAKVLTVDIAKNVEKINPIITFNFINVFLSRMDSR